MTKLKNTKKGMAKKALSVSLVAAMLATSNVPVWAAEDLFSDGSIAAESSSPTANLFSSEDTEDGELLSTPANPTVDSVTLSMKSNGAALTNALAYTQGATLEAAAELENEVPEGSTVELKLWKRLSGTTDWGNAPIAIASFNTGDLAKSIVYELSKDDIGYEFACDIYLNNSKLKDTAAAPILIIEKTESLTGAPIINNNLTTVKHGSTLTADVSNIGPAGTELHYMWLVQDEKGNWNKANGSSDQNTYTVPADLYDKKIRLDVYTGAAYTVQNAVQSNIVTVTARDLVADDINETLTKIKIDGIDGKTEKVFNSDNFDLNALTATDIDVYMGDTKLIYGSDYSLTYDKLNQSGTVHVTVNIRPTANTQYTEGTYTKLSYTLKPGQSLAGYNIELGTTNYEYTGKAITPSIGKVTYSSNGEERTLNPSEYTIQTVGPNVGKYVLSVNVTGKGTVYYNIGEKIINVTAKNMAAHDEDFNVIIPAEIWSADEEDVINNRVDNAQIKMYDISADPNQINDLLSTEGAFEIKCVNWNENDYEKSIQIIAKGNNNYKNSIYRDGEITKGDINVFAPSFRREISKEGENYKYNGTEQDALKAILDASHGSIDLGSETLYVDKDFTYEITQGGTNAGDVSYKITGAGEYAGTSMVLSNVYKILQADFNSADVYDNLNGKTTFNVPFDPSLGDEGALIKNYQVSAKDYYTLKMKGSNYLLELNKDYWLDMQSSDNESIVYEPTVAADSKYDHGQNDNFKQTAGKTDREEITAQLVAKDLSSSDIRVEIVDSSFNSGAVVEPTIKVYYVAKDGKEYEIDKAYYKTEISKPATQEGETGRIFVAAKTKEELAALTATTGKAYPQMYTGGQSVSFTVGTPSLEEAKILATNGLSTLPSVEFDAEQAASSTGIVLPSDKYRVEDKSGNVVDPRYYTVSFTNNRSAGEATITVTGKAPYTGSTSATFTITKNTLPTGTITLMSDELSKAYTGEGIELTAGIDYTVSGELAKLTANTDYMVTYEDNINVTDSNTKAKIKFVGINNYAGEIVKTFDITPAKIEASNVVLGDTTYAGGATIKPTVTVNIPGGSATLTEGTDYTVEYLPAATEVGDTGKVVITYNDKNTNINAKDSVKEVTYGVTAKDLKDVTINVIPDQEETGEQIKPQLTVMNGSVLMVENRDYVVEYGTNTDVGEGTATIKAVSGNNNYTGTQTVKFNIVEKQVEVGQAVISNIRVSGNTVTPVLSGDVDGAVGYDYVISTSDDVTDTASRVDVSKNILNTNTNFYYVETGTYYVYCHAWMRDENGLKVFGDWSNVVPVEVTAVTPERPMIQSAKLKGNTLTVTWSRSADATGYDIVMGKAARKVNGEMRPVDYGKAVKKITNGDTVTVTFRNIPKGTYYVGLHAWNRTSESGVKVFSPWSNGRKVVVK